MKPAERQAIYARDGGLCGFCGDRGPSELMQLDHFPIPRGLGGADSADNLRVAHRRCNIAGGHDVRRERRNLGLPTYSGRVVTASATTPISLRLPVALIDRLREIARAGDRSLNAQIERMLRASVEREKPDAKD